MKAAKNYRSGSRRHEHSDERRLEWSTLLIPLGSGREEFAQRQHESVGFDLLARWSSLDQPTDSLESQGLLGNVRTSRSFEVFAFFGPLVIIPPFGLPLAGPAEGLGECGNAGPGHPRVHRFSLGDRGTKGRWPWATPRLGGDMRL